MLAPPLSSELVSTLVSGVVAGPPSAAASTAGKTTALEPMDCNPTPPRSVSPPRDEETDQEGQPRTEPGSPKNAQTESTEPKNEEEMQVEQDGGFN